MTHVAPITARARRSVRLHEDPAASAVAAGLRYVSDDEPGLSRIRRGRGFSYYTARDRPASADQVRRIRRMAIPPAWREVWICRFPDGHLQATGIDDRGRKQYLYHARWRQVRDGLTFDRLALIGSVLPDIRAAVQAQLRRRKLDRARVLAGMVRMLDLTGIRVGNENYERDNASIGLTTLRWAHLAVHGPTIDLAFPAKSGQRTEITVTDRALARLLSDLPEAARRRVFRADGRPMRPDDLNSYLAELAGAHVTAKDFRTWRGTVAALTHLRALPAGGAPSRADCLAAIDAASRALNNTRAVARAHYVHPGVLDAFRSGALPPAARGAGDDLMPAAERDLMAVLPTLGGAGGSR